MEISYDIIIKHLSKNDKKLFSNKKHILQHSDKFPDIFSALLQNKFYKYGVTIFDQHNINISLYMSILTLLNKEFITFSSEEELEYMNKFKGALKENYNTFSNDAVQNIQLLCDTLDCTIIIFDFKNKNFKIAYSNDVCNPWKPIFLLANYEDLWEPIMSDSKRTFSYNHLAIKKILLDGNIEYLNNTKIYTLNENIKEYIDEIIQETNDLLETFMNKKELDPFINKKELDKSNELTLLNKKTKNELLEICKTKNIKVNTKMLKKELVDLIINN